jgi:NAD(P)-dependent dehydrogenase (short-subunit alcohol dehydrogenase family)
MNEALGLTEPMTAIVLGARGGLGASFARALTSSAGVSRVLTTSRDAQWCEAEAAPTERRLHVDLTSEADLVMLTEHISEDAPLQLVLNCTGLLHGDSIQPERTWRELDLEQMRRVFDVNALGVALLVKHLVPRMPRQGRSIFASVSARVASIGDNRLGGWYSYRASKAAQNMILKTASIEAARTHPDLVIAALHPGTVDTELSKPFTRRLGPDRLFTPDYSRERLSEVMSGLTPKDSGGLFAWDGAPIPW